MSRLLPPLPDNFLLLLDGPSLALPQDVLVAGIAVMADAPHPAEAASGSDLPYASTPPATAPSAEPANAPAPNVADPDAAGPDGVAPQPPPAAAVTQPPGDASPTLGELDVTAAASAAPSAATVEAEATSEPVLPSAGTPPAAAPSAEPADAPAAGAAGPDAAGSDEATPQPSAAFPLPPEDAFPTLAELDAILAANAAPPPGPSVAERAEIVALLGLDPAIADDPLLYAEILGSLPDPDADEALAQWEREYDVPAPLPDRPDVPGEWQLG